MLLSLLMCSSKRVHPWVVKATGSLPAPPAVFFPPCHPGPALLLPAPPPGRGHVFLLWKRSAGGPSPEILGRGEGPVVGTGRDSEP